MSSYNLVRDDAQTVLHSIVREHQRNQRDLFISFKYSKTMNMALTYIWLSQRSSEIMNLKWSSQVNPILK